MKLAATTIALMLAAMVMFIGCSSYAPVVDVGTMVDIVAPSPTMESTQSFASAVYMLDAPTPEVTAEPDPTQTPEPTSTAKPEPKYTLKKIDNKRGYISGNGINLRTGPDTAYEIIDTYRRNVKLRITGECGEWFRVKIDGVVGFMHKDFVEYGNPPKPTPKPDSGTPKPTEKPDRFTEDEVMLVAKLIHLENKGGSMKGYKAVASVVLNRVESKHFPNTIRDVIYQKNQFTVIDKLDSTKPCNDAIEAARSVLNGDGSTLPADVLFFRIASAGHDWGNSREYYCTIDNNSFFRWKG